MSTATATNSNQNKIDSDGKNLVYCYNKGCNKQFYLQDNSSDACQFHPGEPVFHDALKGWSCCNKKSTDFTQFLNIPGCTKSFHSNQKPPEPEKPEKSIENKNETYVYQAPKQQELTQRPTGVQNLIELKRTLAPSLKVSLQTTDLNANIHKNDSQEVPVGTPCKNATCQKRYENENSNKEVCTYHSGVAIFHEGMKYWSCCQRKTSDFDAFLNQAGCTQGKHLWFKNESIEQKVDCRYDYHQAGGFVVLDVYSKNPVPDKTSIKASSINLDINISFENGIKTFTKSILLFGVIKLEESVVNFYQSKVEIKLKKADVIHWPKLEHVEAKKSEE